MEETRHRRQVHVDDLLKFRVDAVVLMAATLSPKLAEQCRNEHVPLIFWGRKPQKSKGSLCDGDRKQPGRRSADR